MRKPAFLLLAIFVSSAAQPPTTPLTAVQSLFDAMPKHDGNTARTLFLPQAMLYSMRSDGTADGMASEKFVDRLSSAKGAWLERIWNAKTLEHGPAAQVWAEYDFHLDGKFSHCGIDSFSLLKTAAGWKIASITDTRETTGCAPSPLGPVTK